MEQLTEAENKILATVLRHVSTHQDTVFYDLVQWPVFCSLREKLQGFYRLSRLAALKEAELRAELEALTRLRDAETAQGRVDACIYGIEDGDYADQVGTGMREDYQINTAGHERIAEIEELLR